jgi:hypothetical protein
MVTSRAEMEWNIDETFWTFEDKFHHQNLIGNCKINSAKLAL